MSEKWQGAWRHKMNFIAASLALVRARNPDLYEETREVTEKHFEEVLPGAIEKMQWKKNEIILDHGCGVGSTCFEFLLPVAEKTDSKIIAMDNSESMILYASEKYKHDRIHYVYGELQAENSGYEDLKVDKIFSLYTLHMVEDYKKELKAMKQILAAGGEAFMIIVFEFHFYDLFAKLMETGKWQENAKEHLVVPEWTKGDDREQNLRRAFEEIGFIIKDWQVEERVHRFKRKNQFADFQVSVNSFAKSLPEEEHEELKQVYRQYCAETPTKTHNPCNQDESGYVLHYVTVNVLVKNPE